MWENGLNPGVTYLDLKWSSGWLESWEGLMLATDILTTCAESIFRALWDKDRDYLLTFNYITETDATHHNQVNFTEYQNHAKLTYRCDPWSHSGGLQITNFSNSQLRSILKPLTDESQHKLQSQTTSLMLSKWYKYQATTMKLISFNIKSL